MRDLTSCFSDHAIKVSDASCSGNGSHSIFPIAGAAAAAAAGGCRSSTSRSPSTDQPSIQISTAFLFKSKLSSAINPLLINLTWSKNHLSTSLSVSFPEFPHSWKPYFLTDKKGKFSFLAGSSSTIYVHWDFSSATFDLGPDPINNYYVAVIVDFEFALLLGDLIEEFLNRFSEKLPIAEFSMICRKEQVVGRTLHSITRARFGDGEIVDHEITISCRGGGLNDGKDAELFVFIDKKRVVHATKLNWNFRGNQTIFIDGSPVDVMWDMYGWWFSGMDGQSVFMFRKRSSLDSRLWLEEQGTVGFSLLIQAFRSP